MIVSRVQECSWNDDTDMCNDSVEYPCISGHENEIIVYVSQYMCIVIYVHEIIVSNVTDIYMQYIVQYIGGSVMVTV